MVLSNEVSAYGRSFHSMQATSQALHPMQVVVSISLQTCSSLWVPSPGTGPACPEMRWIRSVAWLMAAPLDLFQLHQEALELRGERIGVHHRWAEQVGRVARRTIGADAHVTPVNGDTDLVDLLAVNQHGFDALGHIRTGHIGTARAADADAFASAQPQRICQLGRDFNEWFRNQLDVHRVVLGPVMVVLGEPVSRADDVEFLRI